MSDRLNYDIESTNERLALVESIIADNDDEIVNYYDHHYNPILNQNSFTSEGSRMAKDLESMANYLLYAKDSDAGDDTITEYKEKRNLQREGSIDNVFHVKESRRETNTSIIKYPKIKVNKKDREMHNELKVSGEVIANLSNMIKTGLNNDGERLSISEVKKLKWIRTDIQKDEVAMKSELKKYINFQSVTKVEKDHNALSFIQFDNPEIIRLIIEDYAELRENSYDDTFGYLKIILFAFEELVELSNLEDYMMDILRWKIEGLSQMETIDLLKEIHNVDMKKSILSETTRRILPNIIVNAYKQQKEDWLYTYVLKGDYSTCRSCKVNKLSFIKYYSPDKVSKSGYRSVCKECRNKKYRKRLSPKK